MRGGRKIEVTSIPLHNLVAEVQNGHYRVPRFQREYVWDRNKVAELFDSIYREYPIGSFFLWKAGRGQGQLFRQSAELGIRDARDDDDISFILDGQQRITSLYVTLKGLTVHGIDYGDICFDLLEGRFLPRRVESRTRYIPIWEFWEGSILRLAQQLDRSLLQPLERFDAVLKSYPVSLVEVKDKSLPDVCWIFQRINQSGKRGTLLRLLVISPRRLRAWIIDLSRRTQ